MEVTDETDRDATGDAEDAIFRDVWRLAGREIKPGRSGNGFRGMPPDVPASDMPV